MFFEIVETYSIVVLETDNLVALETDNIVVYCRLVYGFKFNLFSHVDY